MNVIVGMTGKVIEVKHEGEKKIVLIVEQLRKSGAVDEIRVSLSEVAKRCFQKLGGDEITGTEVTINGFMRAYRCEANIKVGEVYATKLELADEGVAAGNTVTGGGVITRANRIDVNGRLMDSYKITVTDFINENKKHTITLVNWNSADELFKEGDELVFGGRLHTHTLKLHSSGLSADDIEIVAETISRKAEE